MCLFITIVIIIIPWLFSWLVSYFTWNNRSCLRLKFIQHFFAYRYKLKIQKREEHIRNIFLKYAKNNESARLKYMFYLHMKAQTHKEMMMGGEWQRVTSRYISKLDFRLMFIGLFGSCFYISIILRKCVLCCKYRLSNAKHFLLLFTYFK